MTVDNLVCTRSIFDKTRENPVFETEVARALMRYMNDDWGELPAPNSKMNDRALKEGNDRIFASYKTSEGKIYIITEWDKSATTILFASEY